MLLTILAKFVSLCLFHAALTIQVGRQFMIFDLSSLTSIQGSEKLQCLYGNLIAITFFQNEISHNLSIKILKY